MTQMKISFDQIRPGDSLEVVWREDDFVQKSFGVAHTLETNGVGRCRTWRDDTKHTVVDNWSRNQDRVEIWLNTNPEYKVGDVVDAMIGFAVTPRPVKVLGYAGRNPSGADIYKVSYGTYETTTLIPGTDIRGTHNPPFAVGERVQTKSSKRTAVVKGLSNTYGYLRVTWDDGGKDNSLAYEDLEAYKAPEPVERDETYVKRGDRVKNKYGHSGVVTGQHVFDHLVVVLHDGDSVETVEHRTDLTILYAPRPVTRSVDDEVMLEIIEKQREAWKNVIAEAQCKLAELKDKKRKILSK